MDAVYQEKVSADQNRCRGDEPASDDAADFGVSARGDFPCSRDRLQGADATGAKDRHCGGKDGTGNGAEERKADHSPIERESFSAREGQNQPAGQNPPEPAGDRQEERLGQKRQGDVAPFGTDRAQQADFAPARFDTDRKGRQDDHQSRENRQDCSGHRLKPEGRRGADPFGLFLSNVSV